MNEAAPDFTNEKLVLQLYVSGMTAKSMEAIRNIRLLCNEYLEPGSYELEIIDLYKNPDQAAHHQIVFSPSLVKVLPLPKKTLIGNFSDSKKVIRILGLDVKD